ncbi:hypothetical protein [Sulfobacillus thermosulfidooxidans]|uniref:Uncharacterized protein n=2 Tax=Sulfobacillus thermosulfidooxidans TaxID=28034 RepID=A0A1W1WAX5_SULTA|nr:hypothetical protein [Sulfobacillus thermosulfidooxidans]OLZ11131.1 hypothetical protein BFX05_08300 [Sulfobacillus thermosulfidooxidans]OLZ14114.1 hypothetical protein BFX06_07350 [Sulfobacillus thermosulfidooxidans]OLZ18858.1 hypothetical protein BFX07_03745 [Sulfobacillus thermosulfidooxidans]PSR26678.1 MAG: hypothetical protein C7B47_10190 [Sulfobacillus thermosulfidooxidans]SMC03424.1 hypothetical protein SAMN00768000_1077 [Sulfobacillus thermosulfidooxidans DSM 9293]
MGDVFLTLFEWVDLGVETMVLIILVQGYRKKYLIVRTLWWIRARYRQLWIEKFIHAAQAAGVEHPVDRLKEVIQQVGQPLSQAELTYAELVAQSKD